MNPQEQTNQKPASFNPTATAPAAPGAQKTDAQKSGPDATAKAGVKSADGKDAGDCATSKGSCGTK